MKSFEVGFVNSLTSIGANTFDKLSLIFLHVYA